jgi:hypothetical protein
MYKNRLVGVVLGAVLIVAVVLVLYAVGPLAGAEKSSSSNHGMGDLQVLEAQQSIAVSGVRASSRSYAGMGDLHRLDTRSSISANPGMGDLQRFEALP